MRARFQPKRTDNLKPEAVAVVGHILDWEYGWTITERDGGPYVGQTAWLPTDRRLRLGWAPDEDLERIEADS